MLYVFFFRKRHWINYWKFTFNTDLWLGLECARRGHVCDVSKPASLNGVCSSSGGQSQQHIYLSGLNIQLLHIPMGLLSTTKHRLTYLPRCFRHHFQNTFVWTFILEAGGVQNLHYTVKPTMRYHCNERSLKQ